MKKNQQLSWNDYLFENRNKAYGAYALRTGESQNLLKSLLIGLFFVGILLAVFSFTTKNNEIIVDDPVISCPYIIDFIEEPNPPTEPSKPIQNDVAPATTTENKEDVMPEPTEKPSVETPPTINRDLGKMTMPEIGNNNGEGSIKSGSNNMGISNDNEGKDNINNNVVPAPEKIFNARDVSKMAVFPGCEKAGNTKKALQDCMAAKLQEELGVQLSDFGETASRNNYEKVSARLNFVVDKSGRIINVRTLTGGNEEFSKEAQQALNRISERLMRKGKYLKPAQLNDGTNVNLNFTIPVQFELQK